MYKFINYKYNWWRISLCMCMYIFIARQHANACTAQYLSCSPVRLSVCLFVTLSYCIYSTAHIVKHFSAVGRGMMVVFEWYTTVTKFQGNPSAGVITRGVGQFCYCRPKSPSFISETVRDRPIVTIDH